jgi:hypothetical protein
LQGLYQQAWNIDLTYTHYVGAAIPFTDYTPLLSGGSAVRGTGNPLADRDYIALSLSRTF